MDLSLVISARQDASAHRILSQDRWRGQYGYAGLPSRKIFTFKNERDYAEIKALFTVAGIRFAEYDGLGKIPTP